MSLACLRGIFLRKEDLKLPSEKVLENKKAMVKQLTERLQNAQAGVLADYRGLTVEQDTELRRKLREANVEYTVLKNSIIRFAAKEVGLEDLDSVLEGPTAIATSNDDVISPAKVLCDFAKGNDLLEIKAGFVEGKVISIDEVKQYASIPSKEVLISKMMGSLQSANLLVHCRLSLQKKLYRAEKQKKQQHLLKRLLLQKRQKHLPQSSKY